MIITLRFGCSITIAIALAYALANRAAADGPSDNGAAAVRRVPKLGVEVPADVRQDLEKGLAELTAHVEPLRSNAAAQPLLPDVQVFHKAVHDALKYQEFFDAKEFASARELIAEGKERATALAQGRSPWLDKPGPTVRGYISKIDGSVQPYGLVLPASIDRRSPHKNRLDFWFHGRGENLSELNFISDRRKNPGQFTPPDTIVLHPYGRYCNASKFAGEMDALEALDAMKREFRIDENRIAVRGFSMGGAASWHFAVHYSDRWFAAAPGAGFSETPDFLKVFQKEDLQPTWYERKLWHWYDCTDYALNLANLPTVAYSGEKDIQKQAADVMESALRKEGIDMVHITGPDTAHSYHPAAITEINRRLDSIAEPGRTRVPREVKLVTYTLRYNRMHWLEITGLGEHWERAAVEASFETRGQTSFFKIKTSGVSGLALHFASGECPFDITQPIRVEIDEKNIYGEGWENSKPRSDRSLDVEFVKHNDRWQRVTSDGKSAELAKRHGLQGPIDDAFMDSFLFVRPTGKCASEATDKWVHAELDRAIEHWRRQFRGEARVKDDTTVTDDDVKSCNLILWGDAQSNKLIAEHYQQQSHLPIAWSQESIVAGDNKYPAENHALVAIYPNPKNPRRYVVLNSSFTYRDFAYLNNARQVAKLPDWAIIDVRTPPDALWPGQVVNANFFDEAWQLKAE